MNSRSTLQLVWLALGFAGCQSIVGIDNPRLSSDALHEDGGHDHGPDGGSVFDGSTDFDASIETIEACNKFCDDVETVCNGESGPQAYPQPAACRDVCTHYDFSVEDPVGPTFACRRARADSVVPLLGSEGSEGKAIDAYCTMLGVGGEDRTRVLTEPSCGTNCDNYCQLRQALCGDDRPLEICVTQCQALVDTGPVNAAEDFAEHPDSIQCRLAHLSMAATPNGAVHCDHSRINPIRQADPETGKPTGLTCDLADDVSRGTFCENYCHMVTNVCAADDEAVWTNEAECLRVCKNEQSLAQGELSDYDQNTWACRRSHTYTALEERNARGVAKVHCNHASIGGGGDHCGHNACEVYCELAERSCAVQFALEFPTGRANCVEKCGDFQGMQQSGLTARYYTKLGEQGGDNYACRLHALIGVLGGDPVQCAAAVGLAAPCVD